MKQRLPVALLLAGVLLRVAATFPVHAYPADSDCVIAGLKTLPILSGHLPVFVVTVRAGAFQLYLHALSFLVFGVSRASLALAPLLSGCALLVAFFLFSRLLFDRATANAALLFMALPAPAVLFWLYMPNTYAETMLFCASALGFAELVRKDPGRGLPWFGFGLAAGLGLWTSFLTLSCLLPALVWLIWSGAFRRPRRPWLALAGLLLGALPWIAYNLVHPLASFRGNFASRPAGGLHRIGSNALYLLTYALPELVASVDPENGPNPPTLAQLALRAPVLAIHAAAFLFALALAARELRRARVGPRGGPRHPVFLLLLVCASAVSLVVLSEAGQTRGLTVRYVLPLFLVVPGFLALFLVAVARRTLAGAGLLGLAVIAFNVSGYFLPGGATRRAWEERRRTADELVAFLHAHQIEVLCGSYWVVYPVNFLSRETIRAIPYEAHPDFDPLGYAETLPARPQRLALYSQSRKGVETWARSAGIPGSVAAIGPHAFVLLPAVNPIPEPAPEFLARLRESAGALLPP